VSPAGARSESRDALDPVENGTVEPLASPPPDARTADKQPSPADGAGANWPTDSTAVPPPSRPLAPAGADSADPLPPDLPSDSPWSRLIPTSLRGARLDPGRRGIAAVAVVAVLAAALAAFGVWRSRPEPIEVATPQVMAPTAAPSASAAPTVVVAVAGGVRRPGLFTLPVGSRVADAVAAAGGVRPGVSIGLLNLARRLVDGEQVIVGAATGAQPNTPAGPAAGPGAPLNLNTATLEQLDGLPGVGPVLAQRILDYRTRHGAFRSVEQLRDVGGIGEAKFADLRGLVAV